VPEGDTIFRAAATLNAALAGHTIVGFRTVLAHLDRVHVDTPLTGRNVERVTSHGKHIFMWFSGDLILRTHMRMNGSWHIYRPGERWQQPARDMRIVIATDRHEAVAFRVPVAEFRTTATLARDETVQSLGPDLLDDDVNLHEAAARLRALGDVPLGDALLNQRAVAGIGNVFKSEICFAAGVSPFLPASALDEKAIARVLDIARRQLRANVIDPATRALTTWNGRRRTTGRADPGQALWVYGRAGQPCRRCGTLIESIAQGPDARRTYYCPKCQGDESEGR